MKDQDDIVRKLRELANNIESDSSVVMSYSEYYGQPNDEEINIVVLHNRINDESKL